MRKSVTNRPRRWGEYLLASGHEGPIMPAWREWPDGSFVGFWLMPDGVGLFITAVHGSGRQRGIMEWLERAARASSRTVIWGLTHKWRGACRAYGFKAEHSFEGHGTLIRKELLSHGS